MVTTHNERFLIGIVATLFASLFSSLGWIFEGEAVARNAPLAVISVSAFAGGCILIGFAWTFKKSSPSELLKAMTPRFIAFSLFRSALVSLVFAYSLTLTSSTKTMFLTKIEPYIVLLLQIFFHGHTTTPTHLALLAIHIVGAVLLSTGGDLSLSQGTTGDILILLAITANAAMYAPSQRYAQSMGALAASGASQLLAGVCLLPFALLLYFKDFALAGEHGVGWGYTALCIVIFYVLSTALWFSSLKDIPAWLASALRCVGPVIAAPIAWIVFDRPLSLLQALGATVVVGTSMWMVVIEKRKSPAQKS
jgi:drug/metabolite transporter (DMT)-like permease